MARLPGHRAATHLARRLGRSDLLVHPLVQRDDSDRAGARPAQHGANLHLVDLQADRAIANALCVNDSADSTDRRAIGYCRDDSPKVTSIPWLCSAILRAAIGKSRKRGEYVEIANASAPRIAKAVDHQVALSASPFPRSRSQVGLLL